MSSRSGPEIRSQRVRKKVMDTLSLIETEISRSEGIYPRGRLTTVEIARRAGVSRSTVNRMTEPGKLVRDYARSQQTETDAGSKSRPKPAHIKKIREMKSVMSMLEADRTDLKLKLETERANVRRLEKIVENLQDKIENPLKKEGKKKHS